jgi:hypothetical protein
VVVENLYHQFFHKNLSPLDFSGVVGIYIPSTLEGFSFVKFLIITNLLSYGKNTSCSKFFDV